MHNDTNITFFNDTIPLKADDDFKIKLTIILFMGMAMAIGISALLAIWSNRGSRSEDRQINQDERLNLEEKEEEEEEEQTATFSSSHQA